MPTTSLTTSPSTEKYLAPAVPEVPPRRVIIFSGHMIDTPTRAQPRFPPAKESAVQRRLAQQLEGLQVGAGDLCVSGAARGGDMLFAAECARRDAEVWLFLPRPQEEFLEESVRLPGACWEERFHALLARSNVRTFFQSDHLQRVHDDLNVHARNNLWIIETARRLAPSPESIHALLVWNEETAGDGPGGTADFVERVQCLGGGVMPTVNPAKLASEN